MLLRMRALFADASGQDSDGSTTPPTDRRDYERADVNSDVMVQYGDRLLAGQLRDVSISGALVEADEAIEVGQRIEIILPRIESRVAAEVMRAHGAVIGIRFLDPGMGVLVAGWSRGTSGVFRGGD